MTATTCTKLTILAIDDETEVLGSIEQIVTQAGHACWCAQNAEAAKRSIAAGAPDLIVADLNLAGHSGLALCEQLKRQFGLSDVPVMYLSAAQVPDIIRRAHAAGGTYYLRKPFDPQVLLQLIDKARRAPQLSSVAAGSA